jgi:hypothetical protein
MGPNEAPANVYNILNSVAVRAALHGTLEKNIVLTMCMEPKGKGTFGSFIDLNNHRLPILHGLLEISI